MLTGDHHVETYQVTRARSVRAAACRSRIATISAPNTAGGRVNDYCHYCYDRGQFTDPTLTADQMIEQSAEFLVRQTCMTGEEARLLAAETIPQLKRWQTVFPA